MKPTVRCSVANCAYWEQGNECRADAILIEIDQHAHRDYNSEFAYDNDGQAHEDHASDVSNTCCHTFEPRKK